MQLICVDQKKEVETFDRDRVYWLFETCETLFTVKDRDVDFKSKILKILTDFKENIVWSNTVRQYVPIEHSVMKEMFCVCIVQRVVINHPCILNTWNVVSGTKLFK